MPTFGERIEEYRRDCGLTQADLCTITGQSRSRVNEYIKKGETPTYSTFIEISRALWASRDWLSGEQTAERWCPSIHELRVALRDGARRMDQSLNVYARMAALLRATQHHLHLPNDNWLLPAVVNIGGVFGGEAPGIEKNRELYLDFMEGRYRRETLTWIMRRLSSFTGLPRLWVELGKPEDLEPNELDDLGAWARTIERARRMGHTPDLYDTYMDSIDDLFRRYAVKQ